MGKETFVHIDHVPWNFLNSPKNWRSSTYEEHILFATMSFGYQVQEGNHKFDGWLFDPAAFLSFLNCCHHFTYGI